MKNSDNKILTKVSIILNYYQDIADVLDDEESKEMKLKKIRRLNEKIGKVVANILPG